MPDQLSLTLVLNPADKDDRTSSVIAPAGERVFMRIFASNDSDHAVAFDQLSCEIYANWGNDILQLAPSDCPHAGDLANSSNSTACSVSGRIASAGGLQDDGDPGNGTQLDLVQTLMPGTQVGGWRLGTGKAGLQALGDAFILQPGEMMHVADGRTRATGMIAASLGTTPVIALGFASHQGVPLAVVPGNAEVTVVEAT